MTEQFLNDVLYAIQAISKPSVADIAMCVITFIYVIATIIICCSNCKSASIASEQLTEARKQLEEVEKQYIESQAQQAQNVGIQLYDRRKTVLIKVEAGQDKDLVYDMKFLFDERCLEEFKKTQAQFRRYQVFNRGIFMYFEAFSKEYPTEYVDCLNSIDDTDVHTLETATANCDVSLLEAVEETILPVFLKHTEDYYVELPPDEICDDQGKLNLKAMSAQRKQAHEDYKEAKKALLCEMERVIKSGLSLFQ